jgi:LysM repeat protein
MKRTILFSLSLVAAQFWALPPASLATPQAGQVVAPQPNPGDEEKLKQPYKIKYGETLSGIAAKFGMKTADLLRLNHLKNADSIREGQSIWVIDRKVAPVLAAASVAKPVAASPVPVALPASGQHTVQEGETLSKIALRYGLKVEDLRRWNHLKDNMLQVNQKLFLNESAAAASPEAAPKGTGVQVREKGMGEMITGVSTPMMVALHRKAPVGSVLRVYNPSSGGVVFARVIGKLPDLDSEKKVMVKLSKSACSSIGIINEQFPIEVSYEQ